MIVWGWPLSIKTFIPTGSCPGAFGAVRKHDIHTGVDLYCPITTPVFAAEPGMVANVFRFTGESIGSPWWNETDAVMVEGPSGIILYGEIFPVVEIYQHVDRGQPIGFVKQVLRKDKGRPMSMLHLEFYRHGTKGPVTWHLNTPQPEGLLDPTAYLLNAEVFSDVPII